MWPLILLAPPVSSLTGLAPQAFTLAEILAVVGPVVVALALMTWFFVQKWLGTYQCSLDTAIEDLRKRMGEQEQRLIAIDEKLSAYKDAVADQCALRHEKLHDVLGGMVKDSAELTERFMLRSDFERDRTTLHEQGKAILAKVEEIAGEVSSRVKSNQQ